MARTFGVIFCFLNLKIIALQYCVTSAIHQPESAVGMCMSPTLSNTPPTSHPSKLLQSPSLSSVNYTVNSHWLSTSWMVVYMFPGYSRQLTYS